MLGGKEDVRLPKEQGRHDDGYRVAGTGLTTGK